MDRPCVARGFWRWRGWSCANVSGLLVELLLRAMMDIRALPISLADRPVAAIWVTRSRMRRRDRSPSPVPLADLGGILQIGRQPMWLLRRAQHTSEARSRDRDTGRSRQ